MSIIGDASNIRVGTNPPFILDDFYLMYPQFKPIVNGPIILPEAIISMYISFSNECIQEARWHSSWKIAMGLFVAHFCALQLQGMAETSSASATVIAVSQSKGLITSKSVGDVSVSYDFSAANQDLNGWATWKLTTYGTQLATLGKLVGKGGMWVW